MSAGEPTLIVDGENASRLDSRETHVQLRAANVTAINGTFAIWEGFDEALQNLQHARRWFAEFEDLIRPVRTAADIERARVERRTGVIVGWQNASPIGDDLDRMALFYDLGVRIVQLTYNERNLVGDGCYEATDAGLSRFGRDLVAELNRLGVLVDLSHCGDRTTLDAIELSDRPVAITHANRKSDVDHPRNKTDDAIRALVERGGVIGANAFPQFFPTGYATTIHDYADCIASLVDVAGIDHVGVGTDFCDGQPRDWFRWIFSTSHGRRPPERLPDMPKPHRGPIGFEGPRGLTRLTEALLEGGFAQGEVEKILGLNWLRLFEQVWK